MGRDVTYYKINFSCEHISHRSLGCLTEGKVISPAQCWLSADEEGPLLISGKICYKNKVLEQDFQPRCVVLGEGELGLCETTSLESIKHGLKCITQV